MGQKAPRDDRGPNDRESRASTLRPPAPQATRPAPPRPAPPRPAPKRAPEIKLVPSDRPTPRWTVIPRIPAPPPPPMRPRQETLVFYGAPPVRPLPRRMLVDIPSEPYVDVESQDLLQSFDDDDVNASPFEPRPAKTDRPPPELLPPPLPVTGRARPARRRWLAAGGAVLALAALPLVALRLFAHDAPSTPVVTAAVAASNAPPVVTAAPAPVRPAAPTLPPRIPGTCAVAPESRLLARRALVRGGVEAAALGDRVAFAALTSPTSGVAVDVDPRTLSVRGSARLVGERPLARVVPELGDEAPVDVAADASALRVLPDSDGDAVVGTRDGFIVWGPRDGEGLTRLWRLDGWAPLEAPRVALLGASGERALAYRRGGAIWVGAFRGGAVASDLTRLSASGSVGTPSIDARGDEAVIAWAERSAPRAPWAIRFVRWSPQGGAGIARTLTLPPGGPGERAMAPSVAALDDARFLLAWTETGQGRNQVRAQVFDANDRPLGEALDVSPRGDVAGQEQIALAEVDPTHAAGAVAYLVSHHGGFELRATSIDCAR